jgi:short-subunit dehydrogenase involved in D-alanine esterification of teichoic acids
LKAIAKKYVELGAEVIINGRNEEKVQKCVASLRKLEQGKVIHGCIQILSDQEYVSQLIKSSRMSHPGSS